MLTVGMEIVTELSECWLQLSWVAFTFYFTIFSIYFSSPEPKAQMSFSDQNLSIVVVVNFSHFHILLQNHWANFNQTWHKAYLGKGDSSLFSEGLRPFPRGDNYEIVKIHWQNLKIFFSRTAGPISTKLGTNHLWVKGIQVCSIEGPCPFPRGDNYHLTVNIIGTFFYRIFFVRKWCI